MSKDCQDISLLLSSLLLSYSLTLFSLTIYMVSKNPSRRKRIKDRYLYITKNFVARQLRSTSLR